ncbi:MAG: TonB family protein [Rikenellaceae bacterium]
MSDKLAQRIGVVATILYVLAIALALWFVRFNTDVTEDADEVSKGSILISFGNSDQGSGEVERVEEEPVPEPAPVEEPQPEPAPVPTPTVEESEVEQVIPEEATVEPEPEAREVNKRALFPGAANKADESQGDKVAVSDQVVGSDRGVESEQSSLGGGLSGSFDLAGRSLIGVLPIPDYTTQAEGRVVMNITVDESGRVTSASLKANSSTTNNSALIAAAREAALKATFSTSESFVQSGTITYIFKLN